MFSTIPKAGLDALPGGLLAAYFALVGTVVGSYLNVVAHRLPLGVSTVTPRSRCPRCLMPIRPWHNVPVLGWLALGGRCRDCRVSIPIRYPATEAATGLLFLAAWLRFGSLLDVLTAAVFIALFVVLAAIDVDHRRLPVVPIRIGLVLAVASQSWLGWVPIETAAVTALAAAALLALVSAGWHRLHGADGFGQGDVELIALIGALLGPEGTLAAFVIASGIALAVAATTGLRLGRRSVPETSPFGACLAVGAIVVLLVRGG